MKQMELMRGMELFNQAASGDRVSTGRLLSMVENPANETLQLLQEKIRVSHNCCVIGITGAPGAGKSSLVGSLLELWENEGKKVAVLAIDPSSPFSGGAVLGDRVRMLSHSQNHNFIIRSLGTRGHLGGLTACIAEAVEVMIALDMDIIIVETAGAGQIDVEVAEVTDTTVVVLVPGWGDGVQVAKAGILEIADIYVVNKMDLPGAESAARDIELMLNYRESTEWMPRIRLTKGITGEGVAEVWRNIQEHQEYLFASGEKNRRRKQHIAHLIRRIATYQLSATWDKALMTSLADAVISGEIDLAHATKKALGVLRKELSVRIANEDN
jgi:LAO/AO transport system kinase